MSQPDTVDEMLKVILARNGWESAIVSAYVLVAEVVTSDGLQLVTINDPVAPYWRHRGMLDACSLEPVEEYDDED